MNGTILLIDTSEFQIQKVKYILETIGAFQYLEFTESELFYSIFEDLNNIKLIIIDIAFPTELEGFDVLSAIRRNPRTKNTPIIVTTKYDQLEFRNRALSFSVSDYILKPYQASRLENSVRSLIKLEKKFEYDSSGIDDITMSFDEYIARELKLSDRTKQSLSILLVSSLNYLHSMEGEEQSNPSHETFEKVEALYPLIIDKFKKQLRTTDSVNVNDNGDILIVLPTTDSNGASVVSEKVKNYIEEELSSINLKFSDVFYSVFVTFPDEGSDFITLMENCFKKIHSKEMLEKIASIPIDTREYANKKYKQLRKWTLNF